MKCFITARSELRKVLFLAPSVCGFLFLHETSLELLNCFAPNSHGRHVWSLTRTSLKVKVKVTRDKKQHFSAFLAVCMQFMFRKTSVSSVIAIFYAFAAFMRLD